MVIAEHDRPLEDRQLWRGQALIGRLDDFRIYDTALGCHRCAGRDELPDAERHQGHCDQRRFGHTVIRRDCLLFEDFGPGDLRARRRGYTAADGTYTINVADNTGPWYIAVGKAGLRQHVGVFTGSSVVTSDVTGIDFSVTKLPVISGYVKVGGVGLSGATAYLKQSANADQSPLYTLTTDSNGFYSQYVNQNSGTWYVAATKTGYNLVRDNASQPNITTTDYQFPDITLAQLPTISGTVSDSGGNLYNAAVSISTNADGSSPSQTVYTNTSGAYTAYVPPSTTYYLICKKSAHPDSSVTSVVVATSNVTQNFPMTRNTAVKLVDLDAGGLTVGSHTTADKWTNSGTMGGSRPAPSTRSWMRSPRADTRRSTSPLSGSHLRGRLPLCRGHPHWPVAMSGPAPSDGSRRPHPRTPTWTGRIHGRGSWLPAGQLVVDTLQIQQHR